MYDIQHEINLNLENDFGFMNKVKMTKKDFDMLLGKINQNVQMISIIFRLAVMLMFGKCLVEAGFNKTSYIIVSFLFQSEKRQDMSTEILHIKIHKVFFTEYKPPVTQIQESKK